MNFDTLYLYISKIKPKPQLVIFLMITAIIALNALGYFYLRRKSEPISPLVSPTSTIASKRTLEIVPLASAPPGLPLDLFYDYDVTRHKPTFKLIGVKPDQQSLELEFIYPYKFNGNRVVAKINCSSEDFVIIKHSRINSIESIKDEDIDKYFQIGLESLEEKEVLSRPFDTLSSMMNTSAGDMIFQGLCFDQYCSIIDRGCEIIP